MEYWSILSILSIVISGLGISYLFRNFNIFERHRVIHIPPIPILGATISVLFRQEAFIDFIKKVYYLKPDAKYIGFYVMVNPVILLRDLELIKSILIKNFDIFINRRKLSLMNEPLLEKSLFFLHGQMWREKRNLLSPSFTSSKMKSMSVSISQCAMNFAKFLSTIEEDKNDMDMKDAFTKYANNVIATCAFGIQVDSLKDPNNKFYIYGMRVIHFLGIRCIKYIVYRAFPKLGQLLNIKLVSPDESNYFINIIRTTVAARDAENITRPDMLQLMMNIKGEDGRRELSIDDMAAQAIAFYFGNCETTPSFLSFAAHEIAVNQDIQLNLQREIDIALEESNGELTYEAINRLEYLEAVINETLRFYGSSVIERVCDKDYELPPALPGGKSFVLKKGMTVWIPVSAIQRDEKYYDNPEEFYPERFLKKKISHNSPHFMAFGLGPRMCIGNRFAMMQVKITLFYLLAQCELKPCARTTMPMRFNKKSILTMPETGFWLNVQRRKDIHSKLETVSIKI